jgi:hypothetical protein
MTDAPKKPRGPKKSAADKLAELIASKRKECARLDARANALVAEAGKANEVYGAALLECEQLEAAHKALVGAGDAGA